MSADIDQTAAQLATVPGQLAFLGCSIMTAPREYHETIQALLRPAIDAGIIGPVAILAPGSSPEKTDGYLRRALEILVSAPEEGGEDE